MRCALSCIVLTIGDGNPPNSCTHASAFTASSTAVFLLPKFLISVAGKVPHGLVELGILIFRGIALPTSSNDQHILISTVDSALDNCNVCGTPTASS